MIDRDDAEGWTGGCVDGDGRGGKEGVDCVDWDWVVGVCGVAGDVADDGEGAGGGGEGGGVDEGGDRVGEVDAVDEDLGGSCC